MASVVRVYSDFVCPFCYAAERSVLVRLQEDFDVEIDWRGFELHPETPRGGVALDAIASGPRQAALRDYVRRFAANFGVLDLEPPARLPNTRRALALAEFARDRGRLEAFRAAAMHAHWREHQDLESDEVLRGLAVRAGLWAEAAMLAPDDPHLQARIDAARAEALAHGVTGVPTFLFDNGRVAGCQPYAVLADAARRAGARRRET